MLEVLATILGVSPSLIAVRPKQARNDVGSGDITPAIWFKFRGAGLGPADTECALLIRQLGYFVRELEEITQKKAVGWKSFFEEIQRETDRQAHPREQGREAARMFVSSRGLNYGSSGIGELIRPNLRSMGIVVVESPFPDSKLEGCSFFVGSRSFERPCIFANNFGTTWFRRNAILMHEVAHAIFDSENSGASLDLLDQEPAGELSEERAEAFAQEALAPKRILTHVAQQNRLTWDSLKPEGLAMLVAQIQVEPRTLLRSAVESRLIDEDQREKCLEFDISSILPMLSDRALPTVEYVQKHPQDSGHWLGKRTTTIPSRSLRLPNPYIDTVLELMKTSEISPRKAAEFLMIDEDTLEERFEKFIPSYA